MQLFFEWKGEMGVVVNLRLIQIQYMQEGWVINSWPSIMPSLLSLVKTTSLLNWMNFTWILKSTILLNLQEQTFNWARFRTEHALCNDEKWLFLQSISNLEKLSRSAPLSVSMTQCYANCYKIHEMRTTTLWGKSVRVIARVVY